MSIMYEGCVKEGLNLEEGNVRHFWYTHLKHVLLTIFGLNSDDLETPIDRAWDKVINSTIVKYEEMNIIGGNSLLLNYNLSISQVQRSSLSFSDSSIVRT